MKLEVWWMQLNLGEAGCEVCGGHGGRADELAIARVQGIVIKFRARPCGQCGVNKYSNCIL